MQQTAPRYGQWLQQRRLSVANSLQGAGPQILKFAVRITSSYYKHQNVTKRHKGLRTQTDPSARRKQGKKGNAYNISVEKPQGKIL